MSSIDQVIARSRQPGGFQERKRFTVARQRAIRKMREFALADPHYYVLELIQAAVANAATHVDLRCEKKSFGMSYIGGGFTQEELAQLFDFLFASKQDFEHGDIRQLALGVNALMIMEPDRIIIESGDGTMGGTTRIEINSSENTVDVGTPDRALRGTFVRAEGIKRSKLRGKSNLKATDYGPAETMAIENRCLAAPVPIIVNDHPVFGYKSLRTPALFGFQNVVTFDEGDLYGSIGVALRTHNQNFKLLTWGTWIETLEQSIGDAIQLGGVVAYDRLNKTADHSAIVRDEQLAQMWARLEPYAHKVVRGQTGRAVFQIKPLGGELLEPKELRDMLHAHGTAVVVPPMLSADGPKGSFAAEIGRVLDAPVLNVDSSEMPTLQNLAGSKVRLLRPNLDNPGELAFFKKKTAPAPERPWIIGAAELSALDVDDFVELLVAEEVVSSTQASMEQLRARLGDSGELTGTIYTPVDQRSIGDARSRELWVRVRTVDRVVWQGAVTSAYPGHVLDVDVPAVSPGALLGGVEGPFGRRIDASLARLIAEVMARHAVDDLEACAGRALDSLTQFDIEPGSTGARVALAALARAAVKRLRSTSASAHARDQAAPTVRFSLVDTEATLDLLEVPLFETLDGRALTMRDLEQLMEKTHGLVYGVVPEVEPDLEGLDKSLILDLDLECERLLMQIVGEGAYVRVDKRDVLAQTADGARKVRDVALGLRGFGDEPLLVEGDLPYVDEGITEELVGQLVSVFGGAKRLLARMDEVESEELRRQAVRHLQYFVCRRTLTEPDRPRYGVDEMGLFLDGRGRAVSLADILRGFATHGRMVMVDGRSSDVCELGSLEQTSSADADEPPRSLMMNAWVFELLKPFGELAGAFDFDLTDAEAADVDITPQTAFVVSEQIDEEHLSGRVGLPEVAVDDPAIAVVSSDNQRVYQLRQPAIDYGIVGLIRVESGSVETRWNKVYSAARNAGWRTLARLADRLAELDGDDDYERVLQTLFDFAGRHLRLSQRPDGTVVAEVNHGLAQRILDVPIFATGRGLPVSAQRLINTFCVEQTRRGGEGARLSLAEDVPEVLVRWVERHLRPQNVAMPASRPAEQATPQTAPQAALADGGAPIHQPTDSRSLAHTLERLLDELRPDSFDEETARSEDGGTGGGLAQAIAAGKLRVWPVDPTDEEAVRTIQSDRVRYVVEEMGDKDAFSYATGRPPVLVMNEGHWLVRQALERAADNPAADNPASVAPTDLAWLLLAAYSHINALLEPVTNDHELEFQRRVADALEQGRLVE